MCLLASALSTPPSEGHSRAQEDGVAVELQELARPRGEPADGQFLLRLHPHAVQRRAVGHRRDEQAAVTLERYEAAIEKVVDRWGEHEPVVAVEALEVV